MELAKRIENGVTVVTVQSARIDAASAIQFKDAVRDCTQDGSGRVILDLGQVEFIDSSGLGAIVAAMKLLGPERKLELAALTGDVDRVFRLTRMDMAFAIHPGVSDALAENVG